MRVSLKRLAGATLAGLVLTSSAWAQVGANPNFRVPGAMPGGAGNPALTGGIGTAATLGQARTPLGGGNPYYALPYAPIAVPGPFGGTATLTSNPYGQTFSASSPYGGGGGYGGFPFFPGIDGGGGFLRGVADVTNSNAQYQVTIQQARIAQTQADMSKLDLRRRIFDEARYEQMMRPNPEDVRIADIAAALNRSRRSPPLGEIWSGKALNDLYGYLSDQQSKGNRGPNIPIDDDMLKHVNVTTGTGGSIGLLKDGGALQWPLSLQGSEFSESRKRLDQNLTDVVQKLKFNNPVAPATLKDMRNDLRLLNDTLSKSVGDLAPSEFIEARRYLNQIEDAYKALQDPNVANYFTQKWTAKGKNVAELIKNMSDQGLKFAPSAPGDEYAYRVLHQALAAYDDGMARLKAEK